MINAIELVLFGVALSLTRAKITVSFLILYNVFIQFITWLNKSNIKDAYENNLSLTQIDTLIMQTYLIDGFLILAFATTALFLVTRVSYFIALIMLSQSILQLSMVVVTYLYVNQVYDLYWVFDLHSQVNSNFVILYLISAWMCVYLSRESKNG